MFHVYFLLEKHETVVLMEVFFFLLNETTKMKIMFHVYCNFPSPYPHLTLYEIQQYTRISVKKNIIIC